MVYFANTSDVALVCNEEGKIQELAPNRLFDLPHFTDVICGNMLIVGVNNDTGEFDSLSAEQIEHFTNVFRNRFCITEV